MRVVPDASAASLHPFIEDCIETGSTVHTDGWPGYTGLEKKGYEREVVILRGRRKEAPKLLPRVHRVASLLKRWLLVLLGQKSVNIQDELPASGATVPIYLR